MLHISSFDAMRYCNWRDHDPLTSFSDFENATEHGSYELNGENQILDTEIHGEYQMLFAEHGFTIIHLTPVPTATSPLMFFGEIGREKKTIGEEKANQAASIEQAGRAMSTTPYSDAQGPSSLASRTTLSESQPEDLVIPSKDVCLKQKNI